MSTHDILHRLSETLASRRNADPEKSYTAKLFSEGPDSILKKIGEECAELIMAGKEGKRLNIVWESTDVIYHVLVLLAFYGLSIEDVSQEMRRREGISGIDEKAARGHKWSDCIFCKIVDGKIPAAKVFEDDDILAFKDINPARPVHVLVIPKKHITSLATVSPEDSPILGKILAKANEIAVAQGSPDGFRVIINTGRVGQQEVPHLHAHIVGGPDPVGPMLKRI